MHRRGARVEAERLWHAAETVKVGEAPMLGRVVRWRIPGTERDMPFREVFRRYPFTVLAEGENWSVSGLCGKLWTIERDYPRLAGPDEFVAWREPGTVRVVFAHWIEADGDRRSELVSEARVEPVDRKASLRLQALWAVLGHFERLIGGEALKVAASRAERS